MKKTNTFVYTKEQIISRFQPIQSEEINKLSAAHPVYVVKQTLNPEN
jgi:hypothetical protein